MNNNNDTPKHTQLILRSKKDKVQIWTETKPRPLRMRSSKPVINELFNSLTTCKSMVMGKANHNGRGDIWYGSWINPKSIVR